MMIFKHGLALAIMVSSTVAGLGAARADPDCIGLYVERNKVYAEAHYCFKTATALTYFSNAGCIPGAPHLTLDQQRRVADIQRAERRYNCRTAD